MFTEDLYQRKRFCECFHFIWFMVVATYFHYEKVQRTMCTVIVSNLLKKFVVRTNDLLLATSIKELKTFLCKIYYWMGQKSWLLENLFDLYLQKLLLTMENFLDQGKNFVGGKLPSLLKNFLGKSFFLWKAFLLVENLFGFENICLLKTFLFVKNFLHFLVENFLGCGKYF